MFGNYYVGGNGFGQFYAGNGAVPDQLAQYRNHQQTTMPPQQGAGGSSSGLLWVQGETGAKSFLVAPGQTVLLMDSENPVFYLKSADNSGMPMPLRIFDYSERTANNPSNTIPQASPIDNGKYITREEFEARIAEIMNGGAANGEPSV